MVAAPSRRLVVLMVTLVAAADAQLVETIEVRVTNVEVVVTDGAGRPIRGLTPDDFQLYEGGVRQVITNFHEVAATQGARTPTGGEPETSPAEVRTRRIVIFLDDSTLHPVRRNAAMKSLGPSVGRLLRPGDEAMVVTWDRRLRVAQAFTPDSEAIRRALEAGSRASSSGGRSASERSRVMQNAEHLRQLAREGVIGWTEAHREAVAAARVHADALELSVRSMWASLRQLLGTLGGMEGRKALLLVTGEMPRRPGLDVVEAINALFRRSDWSPAESVIAEAGRDLSDDLEAVVRTAAANGVALYTLDAGERGFSSSMMEGEERTDLGAEFMADTETAATLGVLADATGGRTIARTRNYDLIVRGLAADLDSYYSLGYRSQVAEGSRSVRVTVNRRGAQVRARQIVVHKSTDEHLRDRILANLFHGRLDGDFPLFIEAGNPTVDRSDATIPVTLTFTPSDLTYLREGDEMVGEFAVHFLVGTPDGAVSQPVVSVKPVRFPVAASAVISQKPFVFQATLRVGLGAQTISAALVDRVGGGVGYARVAVTIDR